MAIDPSTLEAIRNPMGGLNIAGSYLKGKQFKDSREDRVLRQGYMKSQDTRATAAEARKEDAALMDKNIKDIELANVASRVVEGYSKGAIEFNEKNPNATDEEKAKYQIDSWNRLQPAYKKLVPQGYQSDNQLRSGLKQSQNIQEALRKKGKLTPTKPTTGMLVSKGKDGAFEVVDSATMDVLGNITAKNIEDTKGLMFIEGGSPMTTLMKAQAKEGDNTDDMSKVFEKAQILQGETITQRSLDSDKVLQNNNLIRDAAKHFQGGGTFRELGGMAQSIISSIPGFEDMDNMSHAKRELFFKTAMQSGINNAIQQKGNLNPQEFKAGLSTAIQKSDSAMGIELASNAFNELAVQDKIVKYKFDNWKNNPENKNKNKDDLRGFDKYMEGWIRKHPPIISQETNGKQTYLYYSQAKNAHEIKTDQLLESYVNSEAKKGNNVKNSDLMAIKSSAMTNFDKQWSDQAISSRW